MFFATVGLGLGAGPALFAQTQEVSRPAPKFLSARPDQAEGERLLQSFRHVGIQGAYWLRFELRVMPRRGPERHFSGEMFGTQGKQGPLTKLSVTDPASTAGNRTQLYLLHGGGAAAAWAWNAGERGVTPASVDREGLLVPLEGTDLTLFDLLMPFLHWSDFVYEGVANVRGRPAHALLLYPPAPAVPGVPSAVRVFLDTQFSALTQTEWLDAAGRPLKTVTVLDLKKTGEQWVVKSIDLRNHATRAKTRFAVKEIATGLELPRRMFEPGEISRPNPPVPVELVEKF